MRIPAAVRANWFWIRLVLVASLSCGLMALAGSIGYLTAGLSVHHRTDATIIEREAIGTGILAVIAVGHIVTAAALFWMATLLWRVHLRLMNQREISMYLALALFILAMGLLYALSAVRIWHPHSFTTWVGWVFLVNGAVSLYMAILFPEAVNVMRRQVDLVRRLEEQNLHIDDLVREQRRLEHELDRYREVQGR